MKIIRISTDFSPFPAGRYRDDGPYSGEKFRDEILLPALRSENRIRVILDGTAGYGSSFLEEVFGGLIRNNLVSKNELKRKVQIVAESPLYMSYKRLAERYIAAATPEGPRETASS